MNQIERLRKMVEDTGEVNSVYGGFEVRILKPALFPWLTVVDELLEIGQEAWIAKKNRQICILSKPESQ
jgi:hypothetical protein